MAGWLFWNSFFCFNNVGTNKMQQEFVKSFCNDADNIGDNIYLVLKNRRIMKPVFKKETGFVYLFKCCLKR